MPVNETQSVNHSHPREVGSRSEANITSRIASEGVEYVSRIGLVMLLPRWDGESCECRHPKGGSVVGIAFVAAGTLDLEGEL